jgi:hypothetical protein
MGNLPDADEIVRLLECGAKAALDLDNLTLQGRDFRDRFPGGGKQRPISPCRRFRMFLDVGEVRVSTFSGG